MFGGVRNLAANLHDSQRFYYSNYQYYNDLEQIEIDYRNDPSKVFFNCKRKSKAQIVIYDTHSTKYTQTTQRIIPTLPSPFPPKHPLASLYQPPKTLEDLLLRFVYSYHQNNYADVRPDQKDAKQQVEIVVLKFIYSQIRDQEGYNEVQDLFRLNTILQELRDEVKAVTDQISEQFSEQLDSAEFLERWYAFQQYFHWVLETKVISHDKKKMESHYLFEFCQYIQYVLQGVLTGRTHSVLLLAQPFTISLNRLVHPLLIPLRHYASRPTAESNPRTLFLNLDGRQSYFNFRIASNMGANFQYISVFRESYGQQLSETRLQLQCSEWETDADFLNMNAAYSRLLSEGSGERTGSKVRIYPLNSMHLRREFSRRANEKGRTGDEKRLPVLQTSEDLMFLMDQLILGQIKDFGPNIIIVSYNGAIGLRQQHFKQIMKSLAIICDHRIILFTNMVSMFKESEVSQDNQSKMMDEENQENQEIWNSEKLKLVQQFLSVYVPYRYENIDQERYFSNLASFIKISTGSHNLKPKIPLNALARYRLPDRLLYLERLASLPSFIHLKPFVPKRFPGGRLRGLLERWGEREAKENKKQNGVWERRLQESIQELLDVIKNGEDGKETKEVGMEMRHLKGQVEIDLAQVHKREAVQEERIAGVQEVLRRRLESLLLQNLQSYRIKKAWVIDEQDGRGPKAKCIKFCMEEGGEQLSLQRYSQLIFNEKQKIVYILNYKPDKYDKEEEDRHCILQGEPSLTDNNAYIVSEVKEKIEDKMENFVLSSVAPILHINYSHCFVRNRLYIFWPQKWNLKEEAKRRLLGIDYNPQHIQEMIRIEYVKSEKTWILARIQYQQESMMPGVLPRYGCTGQQITDKSFLILGGIFNSGLDFYDAGSNMILASIDDNANQFILSALPKKHERMHFKSQKEKTYNYTTFLKPKVHYRIERPLRPEENNSVVVSAGYGREFTNFCGLFSYQSYNVSLNATPNNSAKVFKYENQKKVARLVQLERPLVAAGIGRYLVVLSSQNMTEVEERFSDAQKDWFLMESRGERSGGQREIISFLEEDLRSSDFRTNHKRLFLFGYDRTIRERIYTRFWSPELLVVESGRIHFLVLTLKTDKSLNFTISSFLIPREQDLVSLCLEEDKLFLLSSSPVVHSLQARPPHHMLYEGSLAAMGDLLQRGEVPMYDRFEFKPQQEAALKLKTLFALDQKLFILGGLAKRNREDFLLERIKNKYKLRTRKLECPQSLQSQHSLEMPSPFVIRHQDRFLLYALVNQQKVVQSEGRQQPEDSWQLRIQTLTPNQPVHEETLRIGDLRIYSYDYTKRIRVARKPDLDEPKFVRIIPYKRFSCALFREYLQRVMLKATEEIETKLLGELWSEREDNRLQLLLRSRVGALKVLLDKYEHLLSQNKQRDSNLENEELMRDLRGLYSLANKQLLEAIMGLGQQYGSEYRFIIEDKKSKKVKYVAVGPLGTTDLQFLRVRYKHQFSICLNKDTEEDLFYHTSVLGCDQIDQKDRVRLPELVDPLYSEERTFQIAVSYQN